MTRSIITGATGFVGANLARRLLAEGHDVHLLVRHDHASWRIDEIKSDVEYHEVDLSDNEMVERVVKSIRPEQVFHLAAHGAYASQTDARRMIETNIGGTFNLIQACLAVGFEAFVNAGSSSEYGFKSFAPPESELLEPNSCYAVTKASATLFCRHIAQQHQVNITTLRLYSVFGPYEEPTRLIPALIMRGLEGALPPLANPSAAHDFVYVDDVCDAFLLAAKKTGDRLGSIYNVGTGKQTTLGEAVEIACRVMSVEAEPEWNSMPGREWDTETWAANSQKIMEELGWHPRYTFEGGFTRTLDWFRDNRPIRELYKELRERANQPQS